jgi:hypothetical protein
VHQGAIQVFAKAAIGVLELTHALLRSHLEVSQPFREVTFCASYKCHCLGSCGSRLSWLWGEGVPSGVARGAPNSAAAARDDLAPAYPTLNM